MDRPFELRRHRPGGGDEGDIDAPTRQPNGTVNGDLACAAIDVCRVVEDDDRLYYRSTSVPRVANEGRDAHANLDSTS
jgi:hypothetical protein